jgi:hypothetical protein
VKVNNPGPLALHQIAQLRPGRAVPDRFPGDGQLRHAVDGVIMQSMADDLMAMPFQQCRFVGEDLIFAARLLVEIMDYDNFHM